MGTTVRSSNETVDRFGVGCGTGWLIHACSGSRPEVLERLASQDYGELLSVPDDELMEAGNDTGEVRAWVAVAGAMRRAKATMLASEPTFLWVNAMGVVLFD